MIQKNFLLLNAFCYDHVCSVIFEKYYQKGKLLALNLHIKFAK